MYTLKYMSGAFLQYICKLFSIMDSIMEELAAGKRMTISL